MWLYEYIMLPCNTMSNDATELKLLPFYCSIVRSFMQSRKRRKRAERMIQLLGFFFSVDCFLSGSPHRFDLEKLPNVLLFWIMGHGAYTALLTVLKYQVSTECPISVEVHIEFAYKIGQMRVSIDRNDFCDHLRFY